MEKDSFDIHLDMVDYDVVIFGTGLVESVLSAYLAKANKKILVLDLDDTYASSLKTLSFKELRNVINTKEAPSNELFKKNVFFSNWEENVLSEEELQKENMRYFNIDLQPKLLFSESVTADMDKYMDFRAVSGLFHWDEEKQKFIICPCSKGDIFKSNELTMLEKRELFQLLKILSGIFIRAKNLETDPNSLSEFDKETTISESEYILFQELADKPAEIYFEKKKISKRIQDICLYSIANFEITNKKTLNEFIDRITRFVKSIGIHSVFPYLYTNYGSGDIPQGFSRIAAVFGSVFILHKGVKIEKIEKSKEQNVYKITSNLSELPITCKEIIGGPEYRESFEKIKILNPNIIPDKEEKFSCLRCLYLIKKSAEDSFFDCPRLYVIPPKSNLNNSQPINLFFLNHSSNTSPKSFLLILSLVFLSNFEENDIEFHNQIKENLKKFIQANINIYEDENNEKKGNFEFFYSAYCLQKTTINSNSVFENGVLSIKDPMINIDLDQEFEDFREIAKKYDDELFQQRIDDPFAVKQNKDLEEEGEIDDLIKHIEKLKKS